MLFREWMQFQQMEQRLQLVEVPKGPFGVQGKPLGVSQTRRLLLLHLFRRQSNAGFLYLEELISEKSECYWGRPLRTADTLTLRHDVIFSGSMKLRVVPGAEIQTMRETGHGLPT